MTHKCDSPPSTIFGRPLFITDKLPGWLTANDAALVEEYVAAADRDALVALRDRINERLYDLERGR